jgi:hypothetical protein
MSTNFLNIQTGSVSDRVIQETVAVRLFLDEKLGSIKEGCRSASAGHCFDAAHLLAAALNDIDEGSWFDVEGIWFDEEGLAKLQEGVRSSDLDDIGHMHGFVVSGAGIVADVTADQFGLSCVVLTDNGEHHWYARYANEMYDGVEQGKAWIKEWRCHAQTWRDRAIELLAREQHVPFEIDSL